VNKEDYINKEEYRNVESSPEDTHKVLKNAGIFTNFDAI